MQTLESLNTGSSLARSPSPSSRPVKIEPLTSLRFFAALWVVLFHTFREPWTGLTNNVFAGRILDLGNVAVSFFFMLSGYILAIVYLRPGRPINTRKFFVARFARIYPLFFVTLCLDVPYLFWDRMARHGLASARVTIPLTFVANTFMLQAWAPSLRGLDGPNWSLSAEAFFYLLFPLIGVRLWRLSRTPLITACLGLFLGNLTIVSVLLRLHVPGEVVYLSPACHLAVFVLGILLAKGQTLYSATDGAEQRLQRLTWLLVAFGLSMVAVCAFFLREISSALTTHGLLAPAFAALILGFSSGHPLLTKLFSARYLIILGEASYALYLLHAPIFHLLAWGGRPITIPVYVAYALLTLTASVLSFYYLESPARKFIQNRLGGARAETTLSSSLAQ